jgi:hypothetical protein
MDGVIADPDIVEAEFLGMPGCARDGRGPGDAAVLREVDANSHRCIQQPS